MKIGHLLIISLSSLVIASCAPQVSNEQSNQSPSAVSASVPPSSTQSKPVGQSAQLPEIGCILKNYYDRLICRSGTHKVK